MTKQEQEYWNANNDEKAALEYGVANGTIDAEDALTDVEDLKNKKPVNEPKAPETPKEQVKGGK